MTGIHRLLLPCITTIMHRAIGKPIIRRFFLQYGRHGRSSLSFKLPSVNVPTHVQGYVTDLVNKLAEAHEVAKENTWVRQEKMKEYYDKKSILKNLYSVNIASHFSYET